MDAHSLIAIALAFLMVTVSPGPANIAAASISASAGRGAGLRFGLGLCLGLAVWGVVAATGLGAILQGAGTALMLLKIGGGLYLLWLAWHSARAAWRGTPPRTEPQPSRRWFWRGLALNLSNPKAVVAWMAALSVGLGANDGAAALWSATALCMAIGLLNYTIYAIVFSRPSVMSAYARAARWIEGTVAVLFAAAGLGLLRSALSRG